MDKGLKEMALKYFKEIARDPFRMDEDTQETYAENFVRDVRKWFEARLDFKED